MAFLDWRKSVAVAISIRFIYVVEGIEIAIASLPARKKPTGCICIEIYRRGGKDTELVFDL